MVILRSFLPFTENIDKGPEFNCLYVHTYIATKCILLIIAPQLRM